MGKKGKKELFPYRLTCTTTFKDFDGSVRTITESVVVEATSENSAKRKIKGRADKEYYDENNHLVREVRNPTNRYIMDYKIKCEKLSYGDQPTLF